MTLAEAVAAEDWPRALGLAIEAWRASRSPVLADLVDRIAARCPTEVAPPHGVQRWWMQRARTYDPVAATTLLACTADVVRRSGVERKLFEQLSVLATWPHDPRVARVLATAFAEANVGWRYAHEPVTTTFYEQLAEHLARLCDIRTIPVLERALAEPRGLTVGLRERQRELATRLVGVLADAAQHAVELERAGEIAHWCPAPPPPPSELDERALWIEAAASADARLVLADYLLERGDRRGEIITLACAGDLDNARKSSTLLHEHWERWMGELALVLDRGKCTFEGGLLDIATVGVYGTPEWAYAKVARHRELATIRVVRPGWNASEKGYVAFLDALGTRLPARVRVTATMIEPLSLARPRWPIRVLELVTNLPDLRVPLRQVLALAAQALPDVEHVEIPMPAELDDSMLAAIPDLPGLFPKLARVHVDASRWLTTELRRAFAQLAAAHAFVEVDHGPYRAGTANR